MRHTVSTRLRSQQERGLALRLRGRLAVLECAQYQDPIRVLSPPAAEYTAEGDRLTRSVASAGTVRFADLPQIDGTAGPLHGRTYFDLGSLDLREFTHRGPSVKPIVAYYRVSTQKQAHSGRNNSGLGLEAQRDALECFKQANGLQIVEFTETETGKGADALELRSQLASALSCFVKGQFF